MHLLSNTEFSKIPNLVKTRNLVKYTEINSFDKRPVLERQFRVSKTVVFACQNSVKTGSKQGGLGPVWQNTVNKHGISQNSKNRCFSPV